MFFLWGTLPVTGLAALHGGLRCSVLANDGACGSQSDQCFKCCGQRHLIRGSAHSMGPLAVQPSCQVAC